MKAIEKELHTYLKIKHGDRFVSRLIYYFDLYFGAFNLENCRVLEIGAGPGYLSALCLARGASHVVALDPEIAGSIKGINKQFKHLKESINLDDGIEYLPISLEDFISTGRKELFDYILMCNVINHIDEDAVSRLHLPDAESERKLYIETFKKTRNLLTATGVLLISDAGRYNFWDSLGLRFPACRNINWNIHQNPDVWETLLSEAGFASIDVKWIALQCLRHFKAIVCKKWAAQCLNSYFLIEAENQKRIAT